LADNGFSIVIIVTIITLFLLGAVKNKIAEQGWVQGGLMMAGQGAVAGALSYAIGASVGGGMGA